MSYTPESEQVNREAGIAVKSIQDLITKLQNRVNNPEGWNSKHRKECVLLINELNNTLNEITLVLISEN